MAPKNRTILNLLRSARWRANASLPVYLIQSQEFTAILSSASPACSTVKRLLWGIGGYPVFLRCTPDRVSRTFVEPNRFAVASN